MGGRSIFLDTQASVKTAYSILEKGRFDLDLIRENETQLVADNEVSRYKWHTFFKAPSGKIYSKYGFGFPVYIVPFLLTGKLLYAGIGAASGLDPGIFEKICVSAMGSFTTALSCLILIKFGLRMGFSRNISFILGLFFGFGTIAWHYAGGAFIETLFTFLLLCAVYFICKANQSGKITDVVFSAFAFGTLLVVRNAAIIFAPCMVAYIMYSGMRYKRMKDIFVFISIVLFFIMAVLWINAACFGGIFKTAYGLETHIIPRPVALNFLYAAAHYLISFQKGFFIYSPIVVAALFAVPYFCKREKPLFFLMLGIVVVFSAALFITTYRTFAAGGPFSWGGRYMTVVLPYCILPVGYLLEKRSTAIHVFIFLLFALSFVVNLAGVLIHYEQYGHIKQELVKMAWTRPAYPEGPGKKALIFGKEYVKSFPPDIIAAFIILKKKIAGEETYTYKDFAIKYPSSETIDMRDSGRYEEFKGLNLWYTYYFLRSKK